MPDQPEDITVDKSKFDALLRKIANTPALTPEQKKVGPIEGRIYRPKPKKATTKSESSK
jgi:hypothetical protein